LREDSDIALRIWKSGGIIVYDPLSGLKHLQAKDGGCRIEDRFKRVPEWQVSFPDHYFI